MRSLGGSFLFDSADPGLLVALLPTAEQAADQKPGSEFVMSRLVDLLPASSESLGHQPHALSSSASDVATPSEDCRGVDGYAEFLPETSI